MALMNQMLKMRTIFVIIYLSYCLRDFVLSDVILAGTNYIIKCHLELEYPSWDKLNETGPGSEMITYATSPTFNPDFYATERMNYTSNNKDILLSNVTLEDAGTYQCSKAGKGKYKSTLAVDEWKSDIHITCPKEDLSGLFFSATTGCFSLSVVTAEWLLIVGVWTKLPVEHAFNETGGTGCSDGKERLTNKFEHRAHSCLRPQKVSVRFRLHHSSKTETKDCEKKYALDTTVACREEFYIGCIVLLIVHVVETIIFYVLWFKSFKRYKCKWKSYHHVILWLITFLTILQMLLFFIVTVLPSSYFHGDALLAKDFMNFIIMVICFASMNCILIDYILFTCGVGRCSGYIILISEETYRRWKKLKEKLHFATNDELAQRLLDCEPHLDQERPDENIVLNPVNASMTDQSTPVDETSA